VRITKTELKRYATVQITWYRECRWSAGRPVNHPVSVRLDRGQEFLREPLASCNISMNSFGCRVGSGQHQRAHTARSPRYQS